MNRRTVPHFYYIQPLSEDWTGSSLEGDDTAPGGTASVRFQALDHWALGARYQSKVDLKLTGEINHALDASAEITLPSSFTAGLANTSIKNLTLELNVVWTEWSVYDELAVKTAAGTQSAPKDWDDVWSIRAGGEYALGEQLALRAGYVWDESPVPGTTRAPELPGSNRQMVTGGVGWANGRLGVDAAYAHLWAKTVDMGSIYPLEGKFKTATHVVSLSASYAF
ncbi:OmpP1/FadL family transporter [Pontiella sulfatireligans]|uniref:Outer membrane protein n=1 Tax=Pontiella sulfatireligans TaxID=2750658 RepID=A0A6C2UMV3_9BACT|nr:outer membrane protein transport protein [Pontiella sulfatireligans]VGO20634.1 Putative outer membrane protein [Pontiella sulfatireligans]